MSSAVSGRFEPETPDAEGARRSVPGSDETPTVMRRVRETPGVRWLVALVILPLLMGLIGAYGLRSNVENNLEKRVERQLLGHGLATSSIEVEGRDVTVTAPIKVSAARVKQVVEDVQGVRNVEVTR